MDDVPLTPKPPPAPLPPERPVDAGSQALAEALRSSFVIVKFVMLVLVAVFLASGFFTVGPQQQAIILRFGRPVAKASRASWGRVCIGPSHIPSMSLSSSPSPASNRPNLPSVGTPLRQRRNWPAPYPPLRSAPR